jgi:hypothetical protein
LICDPIPLADGARRQGMVSDFIFGANAKPGHFDFF